MDLTTVKIESNGTPRGTSITVDGKILPCTCAKIEIGLDGAVCTLTLAEGAFTFKGDDIRIDSVVCTQPEVVAR